MFNKLIIRHRTIFNHLLLTCTMMTQNEILYVHRLSSNAVLPVRGSKFAAGYDLSSAEEVTVPSHGKAIVKTDLAIAIPQDTYARVAPRSGLAAKNFIDVGAGVIDFDYRGNVGVVLFNHGPNDFIVHIGDRIAQLILERISMASLEEVTELPASERGTGGFGSTGVSSANRDADVSNEITKRLKTDNSADAETISRLLVFLDSMSESLGDQRRVALKKLALQSDIRVIAAMEEYNTSQSISALLETVDILLDN